MATAQDRKPKTSAARQEVAALMEFLTWARAEGFGFDTVTVGGVQITGARDYAPTVGTQAVMASSIQRDTGTAARSESIYEEYGRDLPGYDQVIGNGEAPA